MVHEHYQDFRSIVPHGECQGGALLHEKALSVEYSELFQLYNQDALDKSIVS